MSDRADRIPYDTAALEDSVDRLVASLGRWQDGDDGKAHIRRAGGRAVAAMDELQVWLHANRARLVGELRESDRLLEDGR